MVFAVVDNQVDTAAMCVDGWPLLSELSVSGVAYLPVVDTSGLVNFIGPLPVVATGSGAAEWLELVVVEVAEDPPVACCTAMIASRTAKPATNATHRTRPALLADRAGDLPPESRS